MPTTKLSFTVFGVPAPQGSMKAFMPKGGRFPVVTADNAKTKPWRQQVAGVAIYEMGLMGIGMMDGAVHMTVNFYFEKPKSASKSPIAPKLTKPDLDKLIRAILDSLTGIAFKDDSQVTLINAGKMFGSPARAQIEIG